MTTSWPDLSRYDLVATDTETTGLTYRDRPVGLSVKAPDGRKTYLRWGHEAGGNNCSLPEFRRWAKKELNRPGLTCVWHGAGFDLRMLAYEGVDLQKARHEDTNFLAALNNELEPSFELDKLSRKYTGVAKSDEELNAWCAERFGGFPTRRSQAKNYWRAPGDIVAPYAIGDVDMTLGLHETLRPKMAEEGLEEVYELETQLIPILLRMHLTGVRADVDYAGKLQRRLKREREKLRKDWIKVCGRDVLLGSNKQLAEVWRKLGLPMMLTEKGNPSFSKDHLEHMTQPAAQLLLKQRQLDWFINVAIQSYVFDNVDDHGFIHGEFHPLKTDKYGTVSGRFSSGGGLNLQNWPARDEEWAPLIRAMLIPFDPRTHSWLRIDYSQIEFRFLAHYAGGAIARAYNEQPDIDFHQMCADLTGIPRKPAKNINFGLVYGMGIALMALKLGLSYEDAAELLNEYHERLPEIRKLYGRADRRAQRRGYILTWGGRKRRFQENGRRGYKNTHKALNALLQGSAADLIKLAMVRVDEVIDWDEVRLHLTVHDELDLSVPKGGAGIEWARKLSEAMEDFPLSVPITAEPELGPNWGHCEAIKEAA